MSDAIVVTDLRKVYPNGFRAVDGISFSVRPGKIFGFLGPNGSGKTTTVRILATLLSWTSGRAEIQGHDVSQAPKRIRQLIGYAGQFVGIDNDLTARENLVFQGELHALSRPRARQRATELLDAFQLQEYAGRRAAACSGGIRRRLDLAQALVHEPPVLFMDEPTTGLDPRSRGALWKLLEQLRTAGTTIFLTTQYLEEADRLCDDVAIIDRGTIVAAGTPDDLKRQIGGDVISVELAPAADDIAYLIAADVLTDLSCAAPTIVDREIVIPVIDASSAMPTVVRRLGSVGLTDIRVYLRVPTLDEVFLERTGRRVQDEELSRERPLSSLFSTIHGKG